MHVEPQHITIEAVRDAITHAGNGKSPDILELATFIARALKTPTCYTLYENQMMTCVADMPSCTHETICFCHILLMYTMGIITGAKLAEGVLQVAELEKLL